MWYPFYGLDNLELCNNCKSVSTKPTKCIDCKRRLIIAIINGNCGFKDNYESKKRTK